MKKKLLIGLSAAFLCGATAVALPKAFYVKNGEKVYKYNFGVAENLIFSDNGHTLSVKGYGESINLDEIDYISFTAPLAEAMTPSAQKERLVKIGDEAYKAFSLHDQEDAIKMFYDFLESGYTANGNFYFAPIEFYLPVEYYNIHGEVSEIARSMQSIVKGNAAAVRTLKSKVVNLYKIEDYNGVYTANPATRKWEKTPSDHFEIHFTGRDGGKYSLVLTAGKEFTTWSTRDFNGQFPRQIDITVNKGNTTLISGKISTVLDDRRSIDMTLDFTAGKYAVHNDLKVVDDRIDDIVKVTIGNKQYIDATTKVTGRNFVSYETIFDAIKAANGYYDENHHWVEEDGTDLCACFTRAECSIDLLGKLQVRGIAHNASKIYDTVTRDYNPHDCFTEGNTEFYAEGKVTGNSGNTIHATYCEPSILEQTVNCLNDHTDAGFYYDSDNKLQGYLGWDITEDVEEGNMYYDDVNNMGYTIINNYLVSVYRDVQYDYDKDRYVYGPWKYSGSVRDDEGNWIDDKEIIVDSSKVIFPTTIYTHYYDATPVLWFPDGTSFSFADFFDEKSFTGLIDDYNEIIDTYLSITGQKNN